MKKPYGLTGGIGCGKSTIGEILEANGCVVYYCDAIAKEIIGDPAHRRAICRIIESDEPFLKGRVDWKLLADAFFSDEETKRELENYVHPLVWGMIEYRMRFTPKDTLVFVESALIYEIGWTNKFEAILVATCSEEEQVRRLRNERGMSEKEINKRLYSQISLREKESRGDYVISTECSRERLEQRVNELCLSLKQINQKEEVQ